MQPEGAKILTESPDAFLAASRADMERARRAIASLRQMTAPRDPVIALEAYDEAIAALGDAAARASVCRNAHPDLAMRDAAETCERELDALMTEISLDRNVYDALSSIDLDEVDAATRHYVEKTLREMRRSGVDRDEETRAKVRALRDELLRIGQEFGNHIKEDVRRAHLDPKELDGLPADYVATHPVGPDGKVVITTDNTDYVPFVTYAKSARAREELWRIYRLRAHPANLEVLDRLLQRRHELATLLGYPSWAAYATEDKMIGTAEAASAFIERVAAASGARAERDYRTLLEQKRKDVPDAERVESWDSLYYQELVGNAQYGFDSQAMRPYFEYRRVKEGVLATTASLFGITYRTVPDAPRWHHEVEVFDVVDGAAGDGPVLGRIYLDMHPRDGKYKHYAQFTLVNGVRGKRLPEGVLMCNFPRPPATADGAPALMEHDGVRTFFHEFGHLLHHVLGGHTRWAGLSGVATEWDFVEAPSQMLEEWVWDVPTLQSFARHVETGEAIPAELVRKARAADEYGKGLWVRQQMFYAALSLEYHRRVPGTFDTTALMAELQSKLTPFRYVDGSYFHESFGHLDGYSALYYTYMWSLVIAKDLFAAFGPDVSTARAREAARLYRERILEPGGSKPAAALVTDFLGRPYNERAYEEWLNAG